MTTPSNFHELPIPHSSVAGRNTNDRGELKPSRVADKYRPEGAPQEPEVSTLSRFAGRLLDRKTGKAYSADELAALILPDIFEVDAIIPGESADGVFSEGAITRKGSTLYVHDGVTPGGVAVGGSSSSVDNHRASGVVISPYYGSVGSTVKVANTRYFQKICDLAVTPSDVVAGKRVSLVGFMRTFSNVAIGSSAREIYLVPKTIWDDDANYFSSPGVAPVLTAFSGTTPLFPQIRIAPTGSVLDAECRFWVSGVLQSDASIVLDATAGFRSRGHEYTTATPAATAWSDTGTTQGLGAGYLTIGEDNEFVVVMRVEAAATLQTRTISYDISINFK